MFFCKKTVYICTIKHDNDFDKGLKITKMSELKTRYDKLTNREIKQLCKVLGTHGHLKSATDLTGLNPNTINRAKNGLQILVENAAIIREMLLPKKK